MNKTLVVQVVTGEMPSKFDDWPFRKAMFKSVDEADKTKYTLNLRKNPQHIQRYNNWLNNLKPGNVLVVGMQDKNPKNVAEWIDFTVKKRV